MENHQRFLSQLISGLVIGSIFLVMMADGRRSIKSKDALTYSITTDWQNVSVGENAVVSVKFSTPQSGDEAGLVIDIDAPWYNDTLPDAESGRVDGLWDFEVVEVFFLGDEENYLELEFGPGGHYLVYYLEGYRNVTQPDWLLSSYHTAIMEDEGRWTGRAVIPLDYFPPTPSKFNAYAIHGENEDRTYMALFPAPFNSTEGPDYHRLDLFGDVNLTRVISNATTTTDS